MRREDIEQFAFLYFCGTRDRNLLSGREKMTFSDFDRLIYITSFLGMLHYNLKMWNQYSTQFQNQLELLAWSSENRIVPLNPAEYEDDIRQQEQWIADFCNNALEPEAQEYLRKIAARAEE